MDPKDKKHKTEHENDEEELEEVIEYDQNSGTRGGSGKQSQEGGGVPETEDEDVTKEHKPA